MCDFCNLFADEVWSPEESWRGEEEERDGKSDVVTWLNKNLIHKCSVFLLLFYSALKGNFVWIYRHFADKLKNNNSFRSWPRGRWWTSHTWWSLQSWVHYCRKQEVCKCLCVFLFVTSTLVCTHIIHDPNSWAISSALWMCLISSALTVSAPGMMWIVLTEWDRSGISW